MNLTGTEGRRLLARLGGHRLRGKDRAAANDNDGSAVKVAPKRYREAVQDAEAEAHASQLGERWEETRLLGRPGDQFVK